MALNCFSDFSLSSLNPKSSFYDTDFGPILSSRQGEQFARHLNDPKIAIMTEWDKVIGHEWAVSLLEATIHHDRIGHAYLITGPAQIGKSTLARTFAQAVNCTADLLSERPCGQCRACTLIEAGRHPDLRLVSGEVTPRGITTLKIDQIRQLQHELSLTATEARYKVAIVEQFESANQNAANAFLKTLEEPPKNVILILTAADADTLLPTISSRCQNIGLRLVPTSLIKRSLVTDWQVPDDEARLYAHLADGRIGWAINVAQAPELLQLRDSHLKSLYEALDNKRVGRFALAEKLSRKPESLPEMLRTWLSWWHDLALLFINRNYAERLTNIDQQSIISDKVLAYQSGEVFSSLTKTSQAIWQLGRNANSRLVIENLLLHYPKVH